jgi:hypothetical protein
VEKSTGSTKPRCGQLAMCWRISKNQFVYMSSRGGAQGIQCPKVVQGGNLAAQPSYMAGQPDKCSSHGQSSAKAPPNSSYKYPGAPPPPAESVQKVRFSPPPRGFQIQSLKSIERGEVPRAGGLPSLLGVLEVA